MIMDEFAYTTYVAHGTVSESYITYSKSHTIISVMLLHCIYEPNTYQKALLVGFKFGGLLEHCI